MGRKLRSVLAGYGAHLQKRFVLGPYRCGRSLLPGELSLGVGQDPREKQAQQRSDQHSLGINDCSRSFREVGHRCNHSSISPSNRLPFRTLVLGPGRNEPVYDILNAGHRHRFTIRGVTGPLIVHNCVQAIARDCLAECLVRLYTKGYNVAFHIHDEDRKSVV